MNTISPNVIWKTPQEVDAMRLAADYRYLDSGGFVAQMVCALGRGPAADRGHKIEPPPLDDENES